MKQAAPRCRLSDVSGPCDTCGKNVDHPHKHGWYWYCASCCPTCNAKEAEPELVPRGASVSTPKKARQKSAAKSESVVSNGRVIWALPSPDAWKARDKILSAMQQLGASREDIQRINGPSPPRIDYKLLPGPQPGLNPEPGEGWTSEWSARLQERLQEFQARQMATYRQGYDSFMGEFPEPPNYRKLNVDQLIEYAAMHLLGRPWKEMTADGTSADELERGTEAVRKSVTAVLKWVKLDPESIRQNRAAEANRIILEIETRELNAAQPKRHRKTIWDLPGSNLTGKDREQRDRARSTLAQRSVGARPAKSKAARPRKPVGRPKRPVDLNRVRQLRADGKSWPQIAATVKAPMATVYRAYSQASGTFPKPPNRKWNRRACFQFIGKNHACHS